MPFHVVGTARAFPGMAKDSPLVVASADALGEAFDRLGTPNPLAASSASTQILAKGDPGGGGRGARDLARRGRIRSSPREELASAARP